MFFLVVSVPVLRTARPGPALLREVSGVNGTLTEFRVEGCGRRHLIYRAPSALITAGDPGADWGRRGRFPELIGVALGDLKNGKLTDWMNRGSYSN